MFMSRQTYSTSLTMLPFLINQQYYNSLKYIFKFYTHYIIKQAIKGFCLGKLQSDKERKQNPEKKQASILVANFQNKQNQHSNSWDSSAWSSSGVSPASPAPVPVSLQTDGTFVVLTSPNKNLGIHVFFRVPQALVAFPTFENCINFYWKQLVTLGTDITNSRFIILLCTVRT